MESTSATLLERLRTRADLAAWDRFVLLYTPFLLGQSPDSFKLNVAIEGTGTVWIKDVEFNKTAIPN